MTRRGLLPIAGIVLACSSATGTGDPCRDLGEATSVVVRDESGSPGTLPTRCAWRTLAAPTDFAVGINTKPLGELHVAGPLEGGGACGDGVSASLAAEDDAHEYIDPSWRGGGTDGSAATCTLTSGPQADRYVGRFTGRLHRIKSAAGSKDEWLDVSFDFSLPKTP